MTDWIRALIDDDGSVASRGALAQLQKLEANARAIWSLEAVLLSLPHAAESTAGGSVEIVVSGNGESWAVFVNGGKPKGLPRVDPFEALLDAARAAYPTLPETVRRQLGECP